MQNVCGTPLARTCVQNADYLRISVTSEDIAKGQRNDPPGSPVGLAIQRAGIVPHRLAAGAVVFQDPRRRTLALLLPESVQQWLDDFERQKPVQPITFVLGLPVVCRL